MDPHNGIAPPGTRGNPQIAPVPLVFSIAQRVSHDLIIQASIECVSPRLVLSYMVSWCSTASGVAVSITVNPLVIK